MLAKLEKHLERKHGVTVFSQTLQNYLLKVARQT